MNDYDEVTGQFQSEINTFKNLLVVTEDLSDKKQVLDMIKGLMELNGWEAAPLSQRISALERDIQLLKELFASFANTLNNIERALMGKGVGFTGAARED